MKFKIFGTEIYISFLFFAVITVMLATDKTGLLLPALFAVFAHETAHLFIMWVLDAAPKRIKLIPASVQISTSISKRYRNDILVSLAGPLVNLILFGTLYLNYLFYENILTLYYALLNLVIGLFNLIPVAGLDGGNILFSLLCKYKDINKATLIMKFITIIIALTVIIIAVMLTIKGKLNISLYIMGIYLFIMSLVKL